MLVLLIFVAPAPGLYAGPTVIRDNRITDLAVTPVLGRGYSVATNSFQSTCLADILMTEPSYDFTYTFESFEEDTTESSYETNLKTSLMTKPFRDYIDRIKQDTSDQESFVREQVTKKGKESAENVSHIKKKRVVVNIDLHSYYASVDESRSKISVSASKLLTGKDYPGFFNSCGSYYVRSIGRNAKFISVLEFQSTTEEEDKKFIYDLESQIKSFRKKIITLKKDGAVTSEVSVTEDKDAVKISTDYNLEDTFNRKASQLRLTITSAAFGLGKNETATLISYDFESFKKAIKDAFISMQNPGTGKVTSMEVVPWVENTEFQDLIGIEESGVKFESSVNEKGEVIRKAKPKLLLYEKKHNLTANAEFFAEIDRADRYMMNIYYKAKICRQQIDVNWKYTVAGSANKIIKQPYFGKFIRNNRTGQAIKLTELDTYLTTNRIEMLLEKQKNFMYGKKDENGNRNGGASSCMRSLMVKGIFNINYRDIKECSILAEVMGLAEDEIVENHCMPVLLGDKVKVKRKAVSIK